MLADRIYREVSGLQEVVVWLCSRIGDPVDKPRVVSVQVKLDGQIKLADVEPFIRRIVARELERMPSFCEELAQGKYAIC
jgi:S-adenosylmethionine synthetase